MVSDAADVDVLLSAGMEECETCDMNDGENVGQSGTVRLV